MSSIENNFLRIISYIHSENALFPFILLLFAGVEYKHIS